MKYVPKDSSVKMFNPSLYLEEYFAEQRIVLVGRQGEHSDEEKDKQLKSGGNPIRNK